MNIKFLLLSLTNAALYLVICVLIGTGLVLELKMDEEDGAARLFGMGQDDWGEIHIVVAITFVTLAGLHLVQHWAWIKAAFSQSKPVVVVIFAGLLLWPTTSANTSLGEQLRHILTDN